VRKTDDGYGLQAVWPARRNRRCHSLSHLWRNDRLCRRIMESRGRYRNYGQNSSGDPSSMGERIETPAQHVNLVNARGSEKPSRLTRRDHLRRTSRARGRKWPRHDLLDRAYRPLVDKVHQLDPLFCSSTREAVRLHRPVLGQPCRVEGLGKGLRVFRLSEAEHVCSLGNHPLTFSSLSITARVRKCGIRRPPSVHEEVMGHAGEAKS
jgi:hypothetical protein